MPDYFSQYKKGLPAIPRFVPTATAWGQQRIYQDPTQLFLDTFPSQIDTTNLWNVSNGNGGVIPTWGNAAATLNSGTGLGGYSLMSTIPTFQPQEPGWLVFAARLNLETLPALATGYRGFGFFTAPAVPTIATPINNGVLFDVNTAGAMRAVSYASGTVNYIEDISTATGSGAQVGGKSQQFFIWFRPDLSLWAINQPDNIVAAFTRGIDGPDVNSLPMSFLAISNGGTAVTIVNNGCSIGDTCRNNMVLSDGTYPFRLQKVGLSGEVYIGNSQAPYPSAPTNVTAANADTAITAANASRRMLIVSNDSTAKLYLLIDTSGAGAASATNFTYVLGPGATFEMPTPISTARVRGFWSAANGSAGVTDISSNPTSGGA